MSWNVASFLGYFCDIHEQITLTGNQKTRESWDINLPRCLRKKKRKLCFFFGCHCWNHFSRPFLFLPFSGVKVFSSIQGVFLFCFCVFLSHSNLHNKIRAYAKYGCVRKGIESSDCEIKFVRKDIFCWLCQVYSSFFTSTNGKLTTLFRDCWQWV